MRLQLIIIFCLQLVGIINTYAQQQVIPEDPEINFLFNYYEQEGNHSAVTGGIGTEALKNMAPMIQVNVPIDSVHIVNVSLGEDYYSSASSNKIVKYIDESTRKYLSSASKADFRYYGNIAYSKRNLERYRTNTYMLGFSKEFDVISSSVGYGYLKTSKNENSSFQFKNQLYYDIWKIILPGEFRDSSKTHFREYPMRLGNSSTDYARDTRISNTLSLVYTQVINKKLQIALLSDFVYQYGLLYTPFNRVFFDDGQYNDTIKVLNSAVDVELLPNTRYKVPLGIRIHYFPLDFMVVRMQYRYYFDDFGIRSHTLQIELPIKPSPYLTLFPIIRYYTQTASHYFYEYGTVPVVEQNVYPLVPAVPYYTSDYDLSAFTNWKYGIGFRYSPLYGLARANIPYTEKKLLKFKYVDMRYVRYNRSDGLNAWSATIDCGFVIETKNE